ncbi:MAG TPA: sugar O-acetyltransferase [Sphingobacterium sp.]|nr:sugar O-acetyltransferase [Sphingobacterium sp.]
MAEKDKHTTTQMYNAWDKELMKARKACKTLCGAYNKLDYTHFHNRKQFIRKIVKSTKENFMIEQPFWCDYGYNIELGENFYANHNLVILDSGSVSFGDNVFVGPNCGFYTVGHPTDVQQRNQGLEYAQAIQVGDNVWIGGNVVVLPGVSIGDNSTIGAGSVVVKNIPANVVAAGNPCRIIRKIK